MKPELKKLLILNAPYLLFVYLFDKIGQAVRLAPGADLSGKVLSLADGFSAAFATPLPSLAPMDLLIGIVGAVLIRLMVYFKGKNAKKYRKGIEYGSARWGNAEDIKPYTDPVFQNNVLLTQTERLTMNSRPKQPKYARNKNILVIGGSGSGKTRFFVKPNLMQMHSSYVVTDPKGTVLVECGKLLQRGGYRIKVLNTINFKKSMRYNPFAYLRSEKDILKLVNTLIANTKGDGEKAGEDFWIIDEEAAAVVRLIFRLFIGGKNRNQIAVHLKNEQIPTPTFYMKDRGRGTCKNKTLNEDNRCKWNKATLTNILTRQEYCGDVVNFKTTKHFRDKHNHYVDRSQWHITENVHEPIISRSDFETVQRILENAPVRRPNGDGEIHPLSGLLFCKDCGAKMHIRIDYRNGGKRHVAFCSEYHKGKAKNPKCHSPHIMDADLLMQTIAEVLKKIEDYSISNRAEFEALVKKNLAMQQTDQTKKQQKRIPQITTRLEQIDKVLNKLYEDNALGTIPQDRYEQMSQKYSEEYYALKAELATLQEQLSAYENAGGRAQKFLKLTERHAAFTELTHAILNEFISRIEVHERDQKRARYAIQHISIYFNYIGKFENEVTQLAEPTEQEIRQMREEIEEAKKEKSRAYHRQYSREYRARNLEKQREYDRMKAREYRARRKAQAAAAQPAQ